MSPVSSAVRVAAQTNRGNTDTMYIGLSILTIFVLLYLFSKQFRTQFKPFLVPLLIFSGLCIGYYAITGKSPSRIPGEINSFFSESQVKDEPSHKYYQDPEKRYGKEIN